MNSPDFYNTADYNVSIDSDLEELIPGYLEGRRKDANTILAEIENNNFEEIRVIGHTMKGTGGGYGFDIITDIGKAIETGAKENNREDIEKAVDRLVIFLDNVIISYE